ncbi:MAG TPA: hypothetical protein PLL66_06340, partial [Bacteroidales bacterium]|nr:hypothetical protein [Bacteroidales bacterium]
GWLRPKAAPRTAASSAVDPRPAGDGVSVIEVWCFEFVWGLGFGIWHFGNFHFISFLSSFSSGFYLMT